eukprot:TRINITY_DN61437_c0_g1_i1.p1 TRINITY_DN61437_c0_g1~~TRINITY_DN61437_c0_g1_i1.p1  ORF type:complete len:836 (+),score=147.00 TRINITY_DN61437_c0_g1_i1:132-2639(+)
MLQRVPQKWQSLAEQKPLFRDKQSGTFSQFLRNDMDKSTAAATAHWEPTTEKQYDYIRSKWTRDLLQYKDKVESKQQAKEEAELMEKGVRKAAASRLRRHERLNEVPTIKDPNNIVRQVEEEGHVDGEEFEVREHSIRSHSAMDVHKKKIVLVPERPISCQPFTKFTKEVFPEESMKYERLLQMANAQEHIRKAAHLLEGEIERNDALRTRLENEHESRVATVAKAKAAKMHVIKAMANVGRQRREAALRQQEYVRGSVDKFVKSTQKRVNQAMAKGSQKSTAQIMAEESKAKRLAHTEQVLANWAEANKLQAEKEDSIVQRTAERDRKIEERLQQRDEERLAKALDMECAWLEGSAQCRERMAEMREEKNEKIREAEMRRAESLAEWEAEKKRQLNQMILKNDTRHRTVANNIETTRLDKEAARKKKLANDKERAKRVAKRQAELEQEKAEEHAAATKKRNERHEAVQQRRYDMQTQAIEEQIQQTEKLIEWQQALDHKKVHNVLGFHTGGKTDKVFALAIQQEEERLEAIALKEKETAQRTKELRDEQQAKMRAQHNAWTEAVDKTLRNRDQQHKDHLRHLAKEIRTREAKHAKAVENNYKRLTEHKEQWEKENKLGPRIWLVDRLEAEENERRAKKLADHMQHAEERAKAAQQQLEDRVKHVQQFRKSKEFPTAAEQAVERREKWAEVEKQRNAQLKQLAKDKEREANRQMQKKEERMKQWQDNSDNQMAKKEQQRKDKNKKAAEKMAKMAANYDAMAKERQKYFGEKSRKQREAHDQAQDRAQAAQDSWVEHIQTGKGQQSRAERWYKRALLQGEDVPPAENHKTALGATV